MESDIKQTALFYQVVGWLHAHRKQATYAAAAAAVIGLAAAIFIWRMAQRESVADEAFGMVPVPANFNVLPSADTAEKFLKVAADHSGTSSGARALLQAAATIYVNGDYEKSRKMFEQFLRDYPESVFTPQAALGIASTLEAARDLDGAAKKYEELSKRYANDSISDQVKLGLARTSEAQGKLQLAYQLYDEVSKLGAYSPVAAEAAVRQEQLLQKDPSLARTNAPALVQPPFLGPVPPSTPPPPQNLGTNVVRTPPTNTMHVLTPEEIQSLKTNRVRQPVLTNAVPIRPPQAQPPAASPAPSTAPAEKK